MRAAVFQGAGRLAVAEWPKPTAGPGEIVLRLSGCGLCGSDIAKITAPAPDTTLPTVFGHEVVGTVAQAGAGVVGFRVGDRVVAAHHVPCGICHFCGRGSESMCRAFKTSHLDPGGFAEYVRVPAPNVNAATFRIPEHLSDEAASFVEPLACCLRAVDRAMIRADDTAIVVGLGSIGCLFVQLLRRAGARVAGVDLLASRAALARRLGADAAGDPDDCGKAARALSDGRGADVVVITGGGAGVLPWAVAQARDGAALHYFAGGTEAALPLPLATLYTRELTISSTYSSSPATLARAFWLISAGKVDVAPLVTHRLPLERLPEGIELVQRHEALKVFVTP